MSIIREEHATKSINKDLIGKYRKRKVMVWNYGDAPVTVSQNPEWSGGTRTYYTFFRLHGAGYAIINRDAAGITTQRKREDGTPIASLAGPFMETTLYNEVVCVETGYFCGKTATLSINGDAQALRNLARD